MAGGASCGVGRGDVIGHVRAIILRRGVVRLMAAVAVRGRIARGVVPADVAVRTSVDHRPDRAGDRSARRQHVRALQRETCGRVVKLSVGPKNGIVARRTHRGRKARGNVVWHTSTDCRRALPRRLMAPIAISVCRGEVVIVSGMTICAGDYFSCRRQLVRAG